jgi:hypothetical protein
MHESKLRETPGPGAYKLKDSFKKKKDDRGTTAKGEKACEFIQEA